MAAARSGGEIAIRYDRLVEGGAVERDAAQLGLVAKLDSLSTELAAHSAERSPTVLARLFGAKPATPPRGLYIWGSVGRGKTMLMDLFFEASPVASKRRVHFHAFMADVHERIHAWRQRLKAGEVSGDDPIRPTAAALAEEAQLLCFDEFAVTDIADAMVLGRLFTALFDLGVVVVATSNVPPDGLYRDGLNRALFVPFIRLVEERMEVVHLASRTDFRLEKIGEDPVYFTPADSHADAQLDALFARLVSGVATSPARLTVHGHAVDIPAQAMGVARFSFADLCAKPLGASDYIAVARAYHTIVLDHVPKLALARRNEARRFITLIDVLYERRVKLIMSAEAEPDDLYVAETGAETFEFARTASRLHEMRSRDYLALPRGTSDAVSGNTTGLAET